MGLKSRQQLVEYCLRRLGAPVIKINITDDQLNDRIDDALEMFGEYHHSGTHLTFVKHQVTLLDIQNNYITLPENVIGSVEVFPLQGFAITGQDMFDIRYQIALNDLYTLSGVDLVPYAMTMSHLNTMNELLIGKIPVRYSRRLDNRLFLDTNWNHLQVGSWLVIKCYEMINPEDFKGIYDEIWIKDYVTALIKKQWGTNLSKFQGMPLPGGMVMNGMEILQQAEREIMQCEEDLKDKYMMPPMMQWG